MAYRLNVLSLLVGDGNVEFLFKFHNQLHRIQGIRSQIIGKACLGSNFAIINTKLFYNDASNLFSNVRHKSYSLIVGQKPSSFLGKTANGIKKISCKISH